MTLNDIEATSLTEAAVCPSETFNVSEALVAAHAQQTAVQRS